MELWTRHEVQWESTAQKNRFFRSAARADEFARLLAKNPAVVEVVRLDHDGPHNRTQSVRTVVKARPHS